MSADGLRQSPLLGFRERQKRQRRRERQLAAIQPSLEFRRQASEKRQAALDPTGRVPQRLADPRKGPTVLIGQGRHHARFIHRACRLGRSVRLKKPRF